MRRFHKKTRTGCAQCKRRRVKCDERKPLCANCEKQKLQCSFEFLTPKAFSSRSISGIKVSRIASAPPNLSHELSPTTIDPQIQELLHHYRTNLYLTLEDNCPPSVWCVTIPQLGLEHSFVQPGMLAISALHLASLVPERRQELHTLALAQESLALPSYRSLMRNPKPKDIHAIFAFAASVVYFVLTSPDKVDRCRLPSRNDVHPHWFQTMRGFFALLDSNWPQLKKGPLGELIYGHYERDYTSCNPHDQRFTKLRQMFSSDKLSLTQLSTRSIETYDQTLDSLRQVAGISYSSSPRGKTAARYWPGTVSHEFAELIYDRDPRALVILAHFCVLLKRIDHFWYLKGLGAGMLENIRLALSEEWQPWIAWTIEQPVFTSPK